jgi:hypothetical protein
MTGSLDVLYAVIHSPFLMLERHVVYWQNNSGVTSNGSVYYELQHMPGHLNIKAIFGCKTELGITL